MYIRFFPRLFCKYHSLHIFIRASKRYTLLVFVVLSILTNEKKRLKFKSLRIFNPLNYSDTTKKELLYELGTMISEYFLLLRSERMTKSLL